MAYNQKRITLKIPKMHIGEITIIKSFTLIAGISVKTIDTIAGTVI